MSPDRADAFVRSFTAFAHGTITADVAKAPGTDIGRPDATYRRIVITSDFGRLWVAVTDGHLPYPYGHETTGYAVGDLAGTLAKAKAAGASVLVDPATTGPSLSAMVAFPGGYIAESPIGLSEPRNWYATYGSIISVANSDPDMPVMNLVRVC